MKMVCGVPWYSTLVYQNAGYETYYYPATDFVTITFPNNNGRWVEIWDFSGKKIVKNLFFKKNILLNLQEVDNGMYFINVLNDENHYPPYKLIVD